MLLAYSLAPPCRFTGTVDEDKGAHFWPMFPKNFFSDGPRSSSSISPDLHAGGGFGGGGVLGPVRRDRITYVS